MLQGKAAGAVTSSAPVPDGENAPARAPAPAPAPALRSDGGQRSPARRPDGSQRRPPGRRGRLPGALALTAIITVAGLLAVLLTRPGATARRHGETIANRPVSPGGVSSSAVARAAAAAWVQQQVSRSAIVSCDPAMCLALQAGGFARSNLLALTPAAADPLGSTVIVATAAVRNQLGQRLASVYAPVVIASFGSGAARVDIRAYAAGSAASYRAALAADVAARRAAGQRLLGNANVTASPAARRDLAAGHADSRLLITLAALAADHDVRIVVFASADPGGSASLPARSAELAVPPGTASAGAYLRSVLAFLQARRAPLLAARTRVTGAGAGSVLRVGFTAPAPLGLLGKRAPA
jgi:hypothetical protein